MEYDHSKTRAIYKCTCTRLCFCLFVLQFVYKSYASSSSLFLSLYFPFCCLFSLLLNNHYQLCAQLALLLMMDNNNNQYITPSFPPSLLLCLECWMRAFFLLAADPLPPSSSFISLHGELIATTSPRWTSWCCWRCAWAKANNNIIIFLIIIVFLFQEPIEFQFNSFR